MLLINSQTNKHIFGPLIDRKIPTLYGGIVQWCGYITLLKHQSDFAELQMNTKDMI